MPHFSSDILIATLNQFFGALCALCALLGLLILMGLAFATTMGSSLSLFGQRQWGLYDFEMVELLIPIAVVMMMPYTHLKGHHISINITQRYLSKYTMIVLDSGFSLLLAGGYLVLGVMAARGSWNFIMSDEVTIVLGLHRWWGSTLLSVMIMVTSLACLLRVLRLRRFLGTS